MRSRLRVLEARTAALEAALTGVSSRRRMREYLGLRWAPSEPRGRQVAYCNICWHEGRELPLEVTESPEQGAVTLVCHHPDHGPGGLRLVRDAGGFHWGEEHLESVRSPSPAGEERAVPGDRSFVSPAGPRGMARAVGAPAAGFGDSPNPG